MTSIKHGRFGQQVLAAMIASACVMCARGQSQSQIVGYIPVSDVQTNNVMLHDTDGRPFDVFNSLCYEIQDGVAVILGYVGTNSTVHLPAMIAGCPVKVAEPMVASIIARITVSDTNKDHKAIDGVLFTGGGAVLVQYPEASKRRQYVIPDAVTTIGARAFSRSTSLTSVILPVGVTSIGDGAFSCCSVLSTIDVDTKNKVYSSLDGVLFDKMRTRLIRCPGGKSGSFIVPVGVSDIAPMSFAGCTKLSTIRIPPSVTRVSLIAFKYCEGLTALYFEGDAPFLTDNNWDSTSKRFTSYRRPDAKGWGETFGGRPVEVWAEDKR